MNRLRINNLINNIKNILLSFKWGRINWINNKRKIKDLVVIFLQIIEISSKFPTFLCTVQLNFLREVSQKNAPPYFRMRMFMIDKLWLSYNKVLWRPLKISINTVRVRKLFTSDLLMQLKYQDTNNYRLMNSVSIG